MRPTRIRVIQMKDWLKIIIRTVVAIIGFVAIGFGGCVGCFHYIGNSNSCLAFNIDNIELRARIGIPAIEPGCGSCKYDKEAKTKTNYFKIRTNEVDMDGYVERNSFRPVNEANMDLSVFEIFERKPEITPDNMQNYYYNSGERQSTDWLAIVDKNSGDLWIHMKIKGLW